MPITFSLANEVFLRSPIGQAIALDQLKSVAVQGSDSTEGKKIASAVKGGISKLASPSVNTTNMLFVMFSVQGCHPDSRTYQKLLLMLDGSYYLVTVHRPLVKPATIPKYDGQSIEDFWNLEKIKAITADKANKIMDVAIKVEGAKEAEKGLASKEAAIEFETEEMKKLIKGRNYAPDHVPIVRRRAAPAAINSVIYQSSSPAPTQLNQGLAARISQEEGEEVYQ